MYQSTSEDDLDSTYAHFQDAHKTIDIAFDLLNDILNQYNISIRRSLKYYQ